MKKFGGEYNEKIREFRALAWKKYCRRTGVSRAEFRVAALKEPEKYAPLEKIVFDCADRMWDAYRREKERKQALDLGQKYV